MVLGAVIGGFVALRFYLLDHVHIYFDDERGEFCFSFDIYNRFYISLRVGGVPCYIQVQAEDFILEYL